MKIKSADLRPGMVLCLSGDGESIVIAGRGRASNGLHGWKVYDLWRDEVSVIPDISIDGAMDEGVISIADHASNVGHLLTMCHAAYSPSLFFAFDGRKWDVFSGGMRGSIADSMSLCAALLAALEAAP